MILVDTALEKRQSAGNPVRVAMIGSGFMGRAIALNIIAGVPGMVLVAIANRTLEGARRAYREAGVDSVQTVETVAQLEQAISSGTCAVTEDAMLLCQAGGIEAIIEVTGQVARDPDERRTGRHARPHLKSLCGSRWGCSYGHRW